MPYQHYSRLNDEELKERLDEAVFMLEPARQAWSGLDDHKIFDTIIACYSEVADLQKAQIERLTTALAAKDKELAAAKEAATHCVQCEADCCAASSPTVRAADEADSELDPFTNFLLRQVVGASLRKARERAERDTTAPFSDSPFGRRAERPTPVTFADLFGLR